MHGFQRGITGLLLFFALVSSVAAVELAQVAPSSGPASMDPNKTSSELNHHLAGYALIGAGLLAVAGSVFPNWHSQRVMWPFLFITAGLFLAVWSDAEIWPRGNLKWSWLLHHDHEAGQHKIYAALLIAMGMVEYLRARGALKRFWRTWSFPILAVTGAALLLIHDHTASSGAHTPEARAYLVNPARDPDGRRWPAEASNILPNPSAPHDSSSQATQTTAMDHSMMDHAAMNHMDHRHAHHMTASMLRIQREHFWFMIVGLAIALFKFLSDAVSRKSFVSYLWPTAIVVLGVLLTLYRE
jgi:hypothetical protein